ncbi:hypothetical protein ACHAXN_002241 [Cyclotella atomus]
MFANGLPFYVTKSRKIGLHTIEFLPSRTADSLHNSLVKVVRFYKRGGFLVKMCLMDMEFRPLEDKSEETLVNTTAAREHVGDIERSIRTIRERARCETSELPYGHCMPDVMLIQLLYFVVLWLNVPIWENGASTELSPREIVTGLKIDFKKHCRALWGSYIEASVDPDLTNTLDSRTAPCIYLGPTGNVQGSVKCYNLETKNVLKRRTFKVLPMPDKVIRRIIKLGKRAKQTRTKQRIQFLNRNKEKFDWDNGELDINPELVGRAHTSRNGCSPC